MEKIYLSENVFEALQKRLDYIFENYDNIYVAFSGGKDSGLLLNLVLKYMSMHDIVRPIGVMHQDFEAEYAATAEYVERTFESLPEFVERYWLCLPMKIRNAMSQTDPWWYPWAKEDENIWVRPMPQHPYVITEDSCEFFPERLQDHDTQKAFARWYRDKHGGGKTIALLGVRASESLTRYSAVVNKRYAPDGQMYVTMAGKNLYSACPLYDWSAEDIWTANAKFGFDYNKLYDLLYKTGCPLVDMRVASPYHDWAAASLNQYRVIDPAAWTKVVGRVNGANFGCIYGGTKAMGFREATLPRGHTWKSYTKFLLSTLPDDIALHYLQNFRTSKKFWETTGGGFSDEVIGEIESRGYKIRENGISNYSKDGKKRIVLEQAIPDDTDDIKGTKDFPSWKRMCLCILRNDYNCKTMGFGPTKQDQAKINAIKKKYLSISRGGKK